MYTYSTSLLYRSHASIPGYGDFPNENISQSTIPKAHTSDWVENTRSRILSIAIHLTGNGPSDFFS